MASTYTNEPVTAIGLMSGTSADGVDAAVITTDGEALVEFHASTFLPYPADFQQGLVAVAKVGKADDALVQQLTQYHIEAVQQLLAVYHGPAPELIGFHGHTIAHNPAEKITTQIGDAALLGQTFDLPVVYDFRTADVQAGGQGAPLVPVYHQALASDLEKPLAVVNIGGVANITYLGSDDKIIAFDTGPGNGLLDEVMFQFTGNPYDASGALAATGDVNEQSLASWLQHPYFQQSNTNPIGPKSLDRFAFESILAEAVAMAEQSLPNALATLTAFTAHSISCIFKDDGSRSNHTPYSIPHTLLVTGGGRHNQTLMQMLQEQLPCPAQPVESVGWRGDSMEAEAFAYLAVRRVKELPITFPGTTGIATPLMGGELKSPPHTPALPPPTAASAQ